MVFAKKTFYDPRIELCIVIAGLYTGTLLYYTSELTLQVLSFAILTTATVYWSYSIRHGVVMSLRDFKLTIPKLGANVLIAIGLAVFGWFYFSLYTYLTRGYWLHLGYGGNLAGVFAIIAVSSAEEIIFRGYLQNRLSLYCPLWCRVLLAVAAMALYKDVVHFWRGMPIVLYIELFLVGVLHNILPSLWMEWSGSLVGPLVLHVVWDLLVYAPLTAIPSWVI